LKKTLILCLLAFCFASAVEKSLAVMPCTSGDFPQKDLENLRDKLEEVAVDVSRSYSSDLRVIPYDEVKKDVSADLMYKATCGEDGICYGDLLANKIQADYGAWCKVSKYSGKLRLMVELYSVSQKKILYKREYDAYNPKNYDDLAAIIKKEVPGAIAETILGVKKSKSARIINEGIGEIKIAGDDYESGNAKKYLAKINSDPEGAVLSFNGVPNVKCPKTPCNVELPEGNVRILANLELYEITDTIIYINQNKQNINVNLKPNFGTLDIKPAYTDGIGKNKSWNLTINDKSYSSFKNRFLPGDYYVKLSHECYEDISFQIGINKNRYEQFDMSSQRLVLKKGDLDLSAELDDKPVSEPVYVNGNQVGETPFSDAVPVCADIGIGNDKDKVNVKIVYKQTVKHKHQMGHFDPSSMYFYLSHTGVTASLPNGVERYVNSISAVLGFELINEVSMLGGGLFLGLGNGPAGIIEGFLGLEFKKLFWVSERRLALPISLGVALRAQNDYIKNRLVAEFIDSPEFLNEPESYLDETRYITAYRIDFMPAIDLQYYITKNISIYAGYLYRISNNPEWEFSYNGDYFKVPERYVPFTKSRESGMLRFGVKYNGRNSTPTSNDENSNALPGGLKIWWMPDEQIPNKRAAFKDSRDGKMYRYVTIGTQTWMAENLSYDVSGSKCFYDDPANCNKYGRFYDWQTALKVCPKGWHLPNKAEWEALATYVKNDQNCDQACDARHLKSNKFWSGGEGLDTYGFSTLPGGYGHWYRDDELLFSYEGLYGYWWSSNDENVSYAYHRTMGNSTWYSSEHNSNKSNLFSVRCLQNKD